MQLQPDPDKPGLWVNPNWKTGDGGMFALVIGVSRYEHLNDGPGAPADETYGLGQLTVSALTAYRFFEWLRSGYALDGLPIAQARLLLSPLRKGDPNVDEDGDGRMRSQRSRKRFGELHPLKDCDRRLGMRACGRWLGRPRAAVFSCSAGMAWKSEEGTRCCCRATTSSRPAGS